MRNFNGGSRGGWMGSRDNRDDDRPEMFQATCATCGQECEVPFKPNGRKPVFCRDCFKQNGDSSSDRPQRPSFDRPAYNKPSFDRPSYDKPKPAPVAPVAPNQNKEQFEMLNVKLDYILKALSLLGATKITVDEKPKETKEVKAPYKAPETPKEKPAQPAQPTKPTKSEKPSKKKAKGKK
ncbi:MAG: CxxC-x17-CxxC domain-containing protein [Candidatus Gracilibacteria bacterium]